MSRQGRLASTNKEKTAAGAFNAPAVVFLAAGNWRPRRELVTVRPFVKQTGGNSGGKAMKIIHTGDWHIGKIVNQVYMTEDQEHILERLIALIRVERPDALIIAGDIYDRAVPPVEAVELLDRTLSRIVLDLNVPVLAVAGNHDSPDRIGFASGIVRQRGLHIEGRLGRQVRRVVLEDEYGPVNFYLIPFAQPAIVRDLFAAPGIVDHDGAMRTVLETIRAGYNPAERNVIVAHGFIRGADDPEVSESEKPLAIGGTEYVNAEYFRDFTYTALGHLHGPQKVGTDRIRYAGSPLKYSFSEVNQRKAVTIVHIGGAGEVAIELKDLIPRRNLRKIQGDLKTLLDPAFYRDGNVEDYLHVTLTDEGEIIDPMNKLRAVYPNVLGLEFAAKRRPEKAARTAAGDGYKSKTKLELFQDFYTSITGREFTQERREVIARAISEAEAAERGA
ncbi:MAG: exonuclease SbcCD subunit D [Negativicutes bacterium]|nr:exonuclease SbcCD subunit D [Negativicutes bacterium]